MTNFEIRIAHSPDSDDAFMFYALATRKLNTGEINYSHVLSDIETLNRKALEGVYEVSAISFHAYAYLSDRYALLASGASMGRDYGPVVVARQPFSAGEMKQKLVAIPGTLTTAYLALRLFEPDVRCEVLPFDQIMDAVLAKKFDAGLLIHEGQLTYRDAGLHKIVDLGEWWMERTGLPLPLGGNIVRRDLGGELMARISRDVKESIRYAIDHRDEALRYAMQFARDLDPQRADRFVGMYVNDLTLDYGDIGQKAVRLLLDEAFERKLIPKDVAVDFV